MPYTYTREGSEFHVNTFTTSDQVAPAVTELADGGYVIVWESWTQDGDGLGVYAQAFNADGTFRGSEYRVNTDTINHQASPAIAALPDGGYVITWDDAEYGQGIHAQIFNADGTRRGSEIDVKATGSGEYDPSVAVLSGGGFVITWWNGSDGSAGGIACQAFNADGTKRGVEVLVNTTTANSQLYPDIAALGDGGYVISWQSALQDGSGIGIYAQAYNANGTLRGGEFRANTYTASDQTAPEVAALADGGYVICWQSTGQDGAVGGIYAQAYNANGTARGTEFRVNSTTALEQIRPDITGLSDGGYLISWESDLQDGSARGIYAQTYNADGTPNGGEFLINSYTSSEQRQSAVAALPTGGFVVSWISNGQEGNYGIYAQTYWAMTTPTSGSDTIFGSSGDDVIDALGGDDYVYGGAGDDTLDGGADGYDLLDGGDGDDMLNGGAGGDVLDGGSGADTMNGGTGDDLYYVDNAADVVIENSDSGSSDAILSSVSYTLAGVYVRTLELTGSASIDATGNEFANILNGNSGVNILVGLGGDDSLAGGGQGDTMDGGAGNDSYYVYSASDIVIENSPEGGTDIIYSHVSYSLVGGFVETLTLFGIDPINATGNDLVNTLIGNSGNNALNGGLGADTMVGGAGNDVLDGGAGADTAIGGTGDDKFYVNQADDAVIEAAGEGEDRVLTRVSYTLAPGVSVEVLGAVNQISTAPLNLTGNEFRQSIVGNAGNNILNGAGGNDDLSGGGGTDTLIGGTGNDVFRVNDPTDIISENIGEGDDMVRVTGASFTLADGVSVETITTENPAQLTAMNLTGNGFNNAIYGTAGANTLRGRGGNDRLFGFDGNDTLRGGFGTDQLTGGAGNDLFVIGDAPESTVAAPDRILDFASGDDIHLSEIDANSNVGGNQAFTFIGASAFTNTAGELRYQQDGGNTFVYGDINGDGVADFAIRLDGLHALAVDSFVL